MALRSPWSARKPGRQQAAMTGTPSVDDRAPTVSDLVARFQLRRRASTNAFRTGVRLARLRLVNIAVFADDHVLAEVRDPNPLRVELHVENWSLVGQCPCPAPTPSVCPHQVAVAHTVWADLRRRPAAGDSATDPR